MKKTIALIISFALALNSFFIVLDTAQTVEGKDIIPTPFFAGGTGTSTDPFQISDIVELQNMAANLSAHYTLINDIDATATAGWNAGEGFKPVGDDPNFFLGSLEGNGFEINDLFINRSGPADENIGLFGYLDGTASVRNVGLVDVNITGQHGVGSFAGTIEGDITGCYASGNVDGDLNTGGLVGYATGTGLILNSFSKVEVTNIDMNTGGLAGYSGFDFIINNCYSTGDVYGDDFVGGLIGKHDTIGIAINSYSIGYVTGTGSNVGGFAGINNGEISGCHSAGGTSGAGDYVGGFIGWNNGPITNSYSTGNASGDNYVGGFVGRNLDPITTCYSTGTSTGVGNNIGGFVGWNNQDTILNSYSMGNASGNDIVGGFVGYNQAAIDNCYSIGNASGSGIVVGGLTGENTATGIISVSHWDIQTSGTVSGVGVNNGVVDVTGNTTLEMKRSATFPTWNFPNIWGIVEDGTYPFLATIDPIITTMQTAQIENATEDVVYAVDFEASEQPLPGHNKLENWTMVTNATWLSIVSLNGVVFGMPTNDDVGSFIVNITVNDSLGNVGYFNYTLVVNNAVPLITTTDILATNTGALYERDYDSTDDPSTTWSLSGNATGWLSIDNDGVLSGTPNNTQAGNYSVVVMVDDGNGGNDSINFTLTVNLDSDQDGEPDATDLDDDNDGYLDEWEIFEGTNTTDENDIPIDTDNDGLPDGDIGNTEAWMDIDDDNDAVNDTVDAFPMDPDEDTDTDGDNIGNNADLDDDNDNWNDTIEIVAGTDPLDNASMPLDDDSDWIANFMDPDFLTNIEYNNNTLYDNNTVYSNNTEYDNNTVYNNNTANITVGIMDTDTDLDGWNDSVEILNGTDPLDNRSMPSDVDDDGIADFMDPDFLGFETNYTEYNNNTVSVFITETPWWAYVALIAAIVFGLLAVAGRSRKGVKYPQPQPMPMSAPGPPPPPMMAPGVGIGVVEEEEIPERPPNDYVM